jgi:hypothetical protein
LAPHCPPYHDSNIDNRDKASHSSVVSITAAFNNARQLGRPNNNTLRKLCGHASTIMQPYETDFVKHSLKFQTSCKCKMWWTGFKLYGPVLKQRADT